MEEFGAGLLAGWAVAVPLGAIGVLIVDLGIREGFRPAFFAGLGTATVDGLYASIAAIAGLAVGAWLAPAESALRLGAAGLLAGIAVAGLLALRRPPAEPRPVSAKRTFARFVALTAVNPLTCVIFAGLIIGLPGVADASAGGKALFACGAFLASLAWQTVLAGGGAVLRHRLPDGARVVTAVAGHLLVLGLAVRLALAA